MTRQAFGIVSRISSNDIFIWIATGDATDSRISAVEALAVREPVWLKSHIDFTTPIVPHNRFPTTGGIDRKNSAAAPSASQVQLSGGLIS